MHQKFTSAIKIETAKNRIKNEKMRFFCFGDTEINIKFCYRNLRACASDNAQRRKYEAV